MTLLTMETIQQNMSQDVLSTKIIEKNMLQDMVAQ